MLPRFLQTFLLAALGATPAAAQNELPFPMEFSTPGVEAYDEAVPSPQDVVGHHIGLHHSEPHQVVAYFRAVGEASDRVEVSVHGSTYEGRPMVHAIVTSADNHARIDDIRAANLRLSDAPETVTDDELARMPAIVYAGYSIHGNEASGTEAALLLLYHLAAAEGPSVDELLDHTVLIIDPMFNPDGRARFTTWVNSNRGGTPVSDPADREHNEPWPGGRTNHYWFDLNRDWLPAQHPESRARLELFHAWRPQVLTDHHEMGSESTFFFQPGIPSRNNPNTPERTFELTARLGEFHAEALDRIGSLYYTRESYDDFYYGKGSTYPDINGAVGILFEQASSRALERETERGTLTYAFTVRNQLATSLSTLEGTLRIREELLRHQRDFYAGAGRAADEMTTKAYVVDLSRAPYRGAALADLLRRHRIRVHRLTGDLEAGETLFRTDSAFIVPVDQPQGRLVKGAMERVNEFRDSLFYDVSTWTLPLAFGIRYAVLDDDPARFVGEEVTGSLHRDGAVVGGRSDYAYLMEWGSYLAPRALNRLLRAGIEARVVHEPFVAATSEGQRRFGRGTIVVSAPHGDMNSDELFAHVRASASADSVMFYAVSSGITSSGPDIGTGRSTILSAPTIALLTGPGTSAYNAGEVWHLLSERFDVPVSLVDLADASEADLGRYDTIVMAGGDYEALDADKITSWVDAGGRLITLTDAVDWAVDHGLLELQRKPIDLDSLYLDVPFEALDRARGADRIGGAILSATVDTTHPVGFGYDGEVPVFRQGATFYEPSRKPGRNVAFYTEEPLMSGYVSARRLGQARGSASIVADEYGGGRVTVFMDNPNFRAFWYGTNGLFLNALFFGGAY